MTFAQKCLLALLGLGCAGGAGLCTLAFLGALPGGLWLALVGGVTCLASFSGASIMSRSSNNQAPPDEIPAYHLPKVYRPSDPPEQKASEVTLDSGLLVRVREDSGDPFAIRTTEEIARASLSSARSISMKPPTTPLPDPFMTGPTRQISPDIVRRLRNESTPSMPAHRPNLPELGDEDEPLSISGVMSLDEELDYLKEAFDEG